MAAAGVLGTAACSGSGHSAAPAPSVRTAPASTAPASTAPTTTASTTTPPTTSPPTTAAPDPGPPPTITTTPVTDATGHVTAVVAKVDGDGNATIVLPAGIGLPAIVHAQHDGDGKFVVTGVGANGRYLSIAAQSPGSYDGTFPLGFVDQHNDPTRGLNVATTGKWHLDIAGAGLAPRIPAQGLSGRGDAVLAYTGPAATASISYPGRSTFTIQTFAKGMVDVLASAVGPYDRQIQLPAGPAFISVTAAGNWSMKLG